MFTRLMAQHPIFGDMRGAVNEKGVVLFLVNDVVDMFGLKPERVVARVMASQGTLHWFDLKLQEGEAGRSRGSGLDLRRGPEGQESHGVGREEAGG